MYIFRMLPGFTPRPPALWLHDSPHLTVAYLIGQFTFAWFCVAVAPSVTQFIIGLLCDRPAVVLCRFYFRCGMFFFYYFLIFTLCMWTFSATKYIIYFGSKASLFVCLFVLHICCQWGKYFLSSGELFLDSEKETSFNGEEHKGELQQYESGSV